MRSVLARFIVQWISRWYNAGYIADQINHAPKRSAFYMSGGRKLERRFLPVAKRLDENSMADQMANEGWWG